MMKKYFILKHVLCVIGITMAFSNRVLAESPTVSSSDVTVMAPSNETVDKSLTHAKKKAVKVKKIAHVSSQAKKAIPSTQNPVVARSEKEKKIQPNTFAIAFNKPTYVLPFYYTGSPYNSIYRSFAPNNESLKHQEIKYQISFKVPLWRNMFNFPTTMYLGYTQMSYWQTYAHDPFFRSTDYEPELYLSTELNWHIKENWRFNFVNLGVDHQSNGFGGDLERSWNRAYVSATASTNNWMITVKPWIILHDNTYTRQNPDMAKFLGYGRIIVAYKYYNQVFSLDTQNFIESGGRRSGTTLSWSFPLTAYLKGYVQAFSGYGQSLIEYNHRTNSVGVGIALSNWV
jgi:phospholipase A1